VRRKLSASLPCVRTLCGSLAKSLAAGLFVAALFFAIASSPSRASSSFSTLHFFAGQPSDGSLPTKLIKASDGNLYGLTYQGGSGNGGTFFKLAGSQYSLLYTFAGGGPNDLVQGTDGNFYGTTVAGGANSAGSLFRLTSSGAYSLLHSFGAAGDGAQPQALISGADGTLYGVTRFGGMPVICNFSGCGTVFSATLAGSVTILHSFSGSSSDGEAPFNLMQAADGNIYGSTGGLTGLPDSSGTVFRLSTGGANFTTLYVFSPLDPCTCVVGANAEGSTPSELLNASDGGTYGAAEYGAPYGWGALFQLASGGGSVTDLWAFVSVNNVGTGGLTQGGSPYCMIQASDGNFYGGTIFGGYQSNGGTLFESKGSQGSLTTVFTFNQDSQGHYPNGSAPCNLFDGGDGNLYGIATGGGSAGFGSIFKVTLGLPVLTGFGLVPSAGTVGAVIGFPGASSTGLTSVKFNGTVASFSVNGGVVSATVPTGATSGTVTIVNSGGTKQSAAPFTVTAGSRPTAALISPGAGLPGDSVQITGSNFTGTTAVKYNGRTTSFTVNSATQITATVPSGAASGTFAITTPGGTVISPGFTVYPLISSVTPSSGPIGTLVTISGQTLGGVVEVDFNGTPATFTIQSATTITATVPSGATSGNVNLLTLDGAAIADSGFTVGP
jgi:uncharacterized repeat protein (TIGR03803 family)